MDCMLPGKWRTITMMRVLLGHKQAQVATVMSCTITKSIATKSLVMITFGDVKREGNTVIHRGPNLEGESKCPEQFHNRPDSMDYNLNGITTPRIGANRCRWQQHNMEVNQRNGIAWRFPFVSQAQHAGTNLPCRNLHENYLFLFTTQPTFRGTTTSRVTLALRKRSLPQKCVGPVHWLESPVEENGRIHRSVTTGQPTSTKPGNVV
ncbi:hypothetical protein BJ742DRAFT_736044 [Cladochytrium replicatum]|nr:hypothetical protein BJ742DRAFT_736044 [Cladochytrium replicatum]